ncbi:MAG: Stp1/IreP family PP2C-type Ser/Thr phosphatase [Anaerolineales bacterium]|nr:Stp1/IreP family PP2C-type Ser/Thr phosphatase [Anaerolineales bacterium]
MKYRLSQVLRKVTATRPELKTLASSPPLLLSLPFLALPARPGQESTRWFLMLVIALIILLFIAVAVLLPLTLRLSQQRQRKKPQVKPEPEAAASLPESLVDTVETTPVVAAEDLGATEPGIRLIKAEREPETLPASGPRPANIGWRIAGLSDTGLRRELNEDNMLMVEADLPCGLYVVADGMGGHDAGEVASDLTVKAIQEHFVSHTPTTTAVSFDDWLTNAVMTANQTVLDNQGSRTEEKKMGSTLVMALVAAGQAHIANVGDSRAYQINSTGIQQISVDHSLVERLVQIGQLTREEARTHKQKNVIYSTIGDKPDMEMGLYHVDLQPGDRLLLCSDGLSGMITDEEILTISRSQPDPAAACKALIEAAKRAGGHDNITAIIVQMDGG